MTQEIPGSAADTAVDLLADIFARATAAIGTVFAVEIGSITSRDLQRYAVASDDHNPAYFEETAAAEAGHDGLAAPPLYLSSVLGWGAGPPEHELRADGIGNELAMLPIDGVSLMGVGQELEFLRPVRAGMRFKVVSTLANVERKSGQSGDFLLFTIERLYNEASGVSVLRCRESFVGRAYQ